MAQKKTTTASTAARKGDATKSKSKSAIPKASAKTGPSRAMASKKSAAVKSKVAAAAKAAAKAKAAAPARAAAKPVASKPAVSKPNTKAPAARPAVAAAPASKHIATPARSAVHPGIVVPKAPAPGTVRAMPAAMPKVAAATISAPSVPKDLAQKAVAARNVPQVAAASVAANKKPVTQRHGFKTNEYIVYPAHGVGRIIGIEEQEIAGMSLELFVIQFEKDKLTLRVPTGKSQSIGMRKLSEDGTVQRAMDTLKGKARIKRTMWSRRAQEYEAKINSGDLVSIAEVVRDLYRAENQPEQSYSERQLYEAALDRMAREIAAVDHLDERGAVQRITEVLAKSAKGRRTIEETADDDVEEDSISAA